MRLFYCFIFIITCSILHAQSEWKNYSAIGDIEEIEVYDSTAFVACTGGVLVIDLITGEEELLLPYNSTSTPYAFEIEFLSNGHAWVYSGGRLRYYDGDTFDAYDIPEDEEVGRPRDLNVHRDALWFRDNGNLYSIKDMDLTNHSDMVSDSILFFDIDSEGIVWACLLYTSPSPRDS